MNTCDVDCDACDSGISDHDAGPPAVVIAIGLLLVPIGLLAASLENLRCSHGS